MMATILPRALDPVSCCPAIPKHLACTQPRRSASPHQLFGGTLVAFLAVCCSPDDAFRWTEQPPVVEAPVCNLGQLTCNPELSRCVATEDGPSWELVEDCSGRQLVCSVELAACVSCRPGAGRCDGQTPLLCDAKGEGFQPQDPCPTDANVACRQGRCVDLCAEAAQQRSNVGCEYWAADLDNAVPSSSLNAAAQQFAVVVSNPQPDLPARVQVEQKDFNADSATMVVTTEIGPASLAVLPLGPREVDGSPAGEFNTGSHTALTSSAYRIRSSVPVVAYQFNPLQNVDVFSNDASLLKPVEALGTAGSLEDVSYVVLGWPQTISRTDDPNTNFSGTNPQDFRAFLTLIGTRPDTRVRVQSSTSIVGGGPVPTISSGGQVEVTLQPFEVLNLETEGFNSDFTGSLVFSDRPVVVFSGSEASDAPRFDRLSERRCCADHLEEQLDPVRSAGRRYVAPVSFNRKLALANAGADITPEPEEEVFRILAVATNGARVRTSLEGAYREFELTQRGNVQEVVSTRDFWIESDAPIMVGNITPSQSAVSIPSSLPGGDPSFTIIPPIEQFRTDYVFLTPDRYSFDFLRIIAARDTQVRLDGQPLGSHPGCSVAGESDLNMGLSDPAFGYRVVRCQLSFPVVDSTLSSNNALSDGSQNDGVHTIQSELPVGVLVDGFDRNVSYGYAAGTELREIVPL